MRQLMRQFRKPDGDTALESGQEAVGQALLVAAVSIGALSAGQLSRIVVDACQTLIAALS